MSTRFAMGRLLVMPENQAALAAVQELLSRLTEGDSECVPDSLYVFGPSGSGKSQLMDALGEELERGEVSVCRLSAREVANDPRDLITQELLIVEDLQHLPTRCQERLIATIDERQRLGLPTIFTALHGPSGLTHRGEPLPRRLTSRLARGLVVGLQPMRAPSRRRMLEVLLREAKVNVAGEIVAWLAEDLIAGGRQLAGAVQQLKTLQALQKKPLRLDDVRAHFNAQLTASTPTVQRIAEHVSGYYRVKPKLVLSARRSHDVLLPRQVSMYLARQLTKLSLQKIGAFFGGRDHKTVQHACTKIEQAIREDAGLSGAVRQLHEELI